MTHKQPTNYPYGPFMYEPPRIDTLNLSAPSIEFRREGEPIKKDMVNSPPHYDLGGMQVIDIRDILLDRIQKNHALSYKQADYWSRAWEYMTRFMEKNGKEDLKKSQYYLNRLIASFDGE
jgi:hypothetical protein